jgi:hypothetical protein
MDNKKILVASGCSFTFEPWNWPTFVAKEFDINLINVGMACQGNGLISKKLIYCVDSLLNDGKSPDDILVGIMWSGTDRHEFYTDDTSRLTNIDNWIENPTSVIPHADNLFRNWVITNCHWKVNNSELYYKYFHHNVSSMIQTLQNILLTQWYLEKKGIKYFMSTYLNIFSKKTHTEINELEVQHWYKMIDFTKFLPIDGCHEWVKENYANNGGFNAPDKTEYIGIHPTEFGHKKFSEEVVIPHIKENILK